MTKQKALGRGLSSLIPDGGMTSQDGEYLLCPIDLIETNVEQPRKTFLEPELLQLAQSIRTHGILQPILVKHNEKNKYTIVAGERRWRAAKMASLKQVPIIVQDVTEERALQLALIENIQRENLNCIEEAQAYLHLQDRFGLKQEEISEQVGKDRSTIANYVRLLSLPGEIREDLVAGRLSMGHARALLSLDASTQTLRARKIILEKNLSVRQTEMLVQQLNHPADEKSDPTTSHPAHPWSNLESSLSQRLGARVEIRATSKEKGKILIHFETAEQLKKLHTLLGKG